MGENTNFQTLDYAGSELPQRHSWFRWIGAVVLGTAGGIGLAYLTYNPMLRFLAGGLPLYYLMGLDEPFRQQVLFSAAAGFGGAVVGFSTVAARRWIGRRSEVFWGILFAGIFFSAASLRLLDVHYTRTSMALKANQAMGVPALLESVPACTVPMVGSVAVVIALSVLITWRFTRRAIR